MSKETAQATVGIAYLIAPHYPSVSHTFILREVRALREVGLPLETASIYPADRPYDTLTAEEREEADRTFVLSQAPLRKILRDHLRTACTHPAAYAHSLLFSLRLAGGHLHQWPYWLKAFLAAPVLGQWMQAKRLAHLHVHFSGAAASVGLLCQDLFPITFSMMVHGPEEFYDVPGLRLREKYLACDFILAISHYARSQIMRILPPESWDKIEITRLGVDPTRFRPQVRSPKSTPFQILCVGRLVPVKGQYLLLQAMQRLQEEGREIHLCLVGDGPDRQILEKAVREMGLHAAVEVAGSVNQDDIGPYFARAHGFVLPSFAEGLPVALMEAMAMGLPCISTRITGHPELIRDGLEGLLVPPSDVDALCHALGRLIDEEALGTALGHAARQRIESGYALRPNMARIAALMGVKVQPIKYE